MPSSLLRFSTENIKNSINNIISLDYILLVRKDKISNVIEDFKSNGQQILNEYLTDCLNLEIALKTDAITNLENKNPSTVTSLWDITFSGGQEAICSCKYLCAV